MCCGPLLALLVAQCSGGIKKTAMKGRQQRRIWTIISMQTAMPAMRKAIKIAHNCTQTMCVYCVLCSVHNNKASSVASFLLFLMQPRRRSQELIFTTFFTPRLLFLRTPLSKCLRVVWQYFSWIWSYLRGCFRTEFLKSHRQTQPTSSKPTFSPYWLISSASRESLYYLGLSRELSPWTLGAWTFCLLFIIVFYYCSMKYLEEVIPNFGGPTGVWTTNPRIRLQYGRGIENGAFINSATSDA